MKVYELMEYLEDFDPDMEVKIIYQPNYPMQTTLDDVKEADGKVYLCQLYSGNDYAPSGLLDEY
ncbi:MAG: hypothetical protein IJX67_05980 [Oscillospiraceae bacterium]|nr:hypothetical protein [Oscillospiraceae bacterium]